MTILIRGALAAGALIVMAAAPHARQNTIADRAGDYNFFDPLIDVRHILLSGFVDEKKLDD